MARNKSHFSGVPRTTKRDPTQDALTENIEVLTGQRGDKLNRALLYRDLVNLDELKRMALVASAKKGGNTGTPILGVGVELPHAPVNLQSVGGFTFIAITWNAPTYGGHAYAEIWRSDTNAFSAAIRVSTEVSNTYSDSVNMGSAYYYWVRFVNQADQIGPIHSANGLFVETLLSADAILAEIEGRIEGTHLGDFLTTEIGRIPDISNHVDQLLLDMPQLLIDVPQLLLDVPQLLVDIENPLGDSVGADLANNYSTTEEAGLATALAVTALKAIIEDPSGTSLGATLVTNHYTKTNADSAISAAIAALKAVIEDPNGSSVAADLITNHYTKVNADLAIATAITAMKSAIEDPNGSSVGADLVTNHYTKADADEAIATAITNLQSVIEGEGGTLGTLSADLALNYYTKVNADLATAAAITALKTLIEDPNGTSLAADLVTNHYTKTNADLATAAAILALKTAIEDPNGSSIAADLVTNHYTKTSADLATAVALTALKALIEDVSGSSVGATLATNYSTTTASNLAISNAITALQAIIENPNGSSIGATLVTDYRTKTDTDTAISTANSTLQSLIEDASGSSVGASLQTLSETVASNSGDFTAMWGVKTTVAQITASFGLLNDGDDPIFAIKGAKFAVITEQDPTVLTPVFAVVDGKTVMKGALIDEAHIQSLVTDDLLSNRIVVGSELNTPSINYNRTTGARSQNFSVDPSGNMVAKSAVLESVTIKDANGNVVMSSTGAVPYSVLTGKPTLGSLAALNSLGYNSLTGKPTLGTFAALNSLSYNSLTGKPTLGSLAALNSLAYNSLTGKPTLGPFAGLAKLLKTNVTTYIESGAIGSAQIDQAYIATLFGNNATFAGRVYAKKIEGDLVDGDVVSVSATPASVHTWWSTIKTISVQRSNDYNVWLTIDDLVPDFYAAAGFGTLYTQLKYGSQTGRAVAVTKGVSDITVEIQVKKSELINSEVPVDTEVPTQNAVLQMFRKGSGFIV